MQIYTPSCIIDLPLIIQFRPSRTIARWPLDRGAANYSRSYQREQKGIYQRDYVRSIITVLAKRIKRRKETRAGPVAWIAVCAIATTQRAETVVFRPFSRGNLSQGEKRWSMTEPRGFRPENPKSIPTTAGLIDPFSSTSADIPSYSKSKRALYICTCVHRKYALYIR